LVWKKKRNDSAEFISSPFRRYGIFVEVMVFEDVDFGGIVDAKHSRIMIKIGGLLDWFKPTNTQEAHGSKMPIENHQCSIYNEVETELVMSCW